VGYQHKTVLRDPVAALVGVHTQGVYLDGTLGGGGHSEALLQSTKGRVLGIDRDPEALAAARSRLAGFGERFEARRGCFGDMAQLAADHAPFHGIILDLGVSSPQLDHASRGFSLQQDGPLDMRMDPDQELDASSWLEQVDEDQLTQVLGEYGEEPRARRIARAILQGRPWHRTLPLAECIARASGYHNSRVHPATRSFQAIRIAVNDELGQLERALDQAVELLAPGGRLGIISFHSLEDRRVKHRFRREAGRDTPKDAYGHPIEPPRARLVKPKGIAGSEADPANPRARSARLRVLERLP
jgi:16S rRNA (cytosine1402-N4)-methyltransferase